MKVSILIVDDSAEDRYLLRRYLSRCSFEVSLVEASDGQEAIDYFQNHQKNSQADSDQFPPLVVFLDINMPRVNGLEFLERFDRIRQHGCMDSTVIVMFTSSPRKEDKEQSFAWDFVRDFIIKGDISHQKLDQLVLGLVEG